MSTFTLLGTSRLGASPQCSACGAGSTISFAWEYAQKRGSPEDLERIALFSLWKKLRYGLLYRCKVCAALWHLDGSQLRMTQVEEDRLALILEWNQAPISLSITLNALLAEIGPTPPDTYGNGSDQRLTPCSVTTTSGVVFETAVVCVQPDAPYQNHTAFRLGSEIAEVSESPFALPLEARLASSRATEMSMGFSPSLIEMPDGKRFVLNGMTSFIAENSYKSGDARVLEESYFNEDPRPSFAELPAVTYFIVDGEPGWLPKSSTTAAAYQDTSPSTFQRFRRRIRGFLRN